MTRIAEELADASREIAVILDRITEIALRYRRCIESLCSVEDALNYTWYLRRYTAMLQRLLVKYTELYSRVKDNPGIEREVRELLKKHVG